jgi:endonuclease YncB( thermonuclease family)
MMKKILGSETAHIFMLFASVFLASYLFSSTLTGWAYAPPRIMQGFVHVVDGDTLRMDGERIRIVGIDAPEKAQYYKRLLPDDASISLELLVRNKILSCYPRGKDKYNRTLAKCHLPDGRDIGRYMVLYGYAVAYFTDDYEKEEVIAKAKRRGLWQNKDFVRPATFRRQHARY